MKRRILIFSLDYYPGEVGGAEVAIKAITDRLDPEQYEFHLVTLGYDSTMAREEKIGNVYVYRIGFGKPSPTIADRRSFPLHLNKHLFQFTAAWKAWRLHRRLRFDGVWAMMAHSCGVPAALFTSVAPQVKFVLTLQEGDPPEVIERKVRPLWPLFRRAFRRADTVQAISSFLGAWSTKMGFPGTPVVIPNAVNYQHFATSVSTAALQATRDALGRTPDEVLLVTTSRLVRKNGLDAVIAALPSLPSNVHFIVFGNGPEKEALAQQATQLGVTNRVHFQGLISHDEMPRYLKACDMFIRPSRSEGMGNSFVEAMAAGVPVMGSHVGGISDFLYGVDDPHGLQTGWVVSADEPASIVTAAEAIVANPTAVKVVTVRAAEMVAKHYDWDVVAARMEDEVFAPLLKRDQ